MPRCGSQCFLCNLPIRFDTYKGCSHACKYCFAKKFLDISKIKIDEGPKALEDFIKGKRNIETRWCDWNIPIHWGGMSDPFQPCEKIHKISFDCLKVFERTQYPFVVSTKGKIIVEKEYLDLIEKCNCVVQISAVCSKYDKLELGAPSFNERLEMAKKIAERGKRVIIRMQPYMHEVFDDVYNNLDKIAKIGVYGIIIEGMKFKKRKKGLVKVAGDYTYPYEVIKNDFLKLKERAHKLGLRIYAGENRIRKLGDSLTCCGIDGIEGFVPNKFNYNYILDEKIGPTEKMKEPKTGGPFVAINGLNTLEERRLRANSFAYNMIELYKTNKGLITEVLGLDKKW